MVEKQIMVEIIVVQLNLLQTKVSYSLSKPFVLSSIEVLGISIYKGLI